MKQRDDGQRIVLGAGTGRSGTLSLAHLLALQPNTFACHEFRPLAPDGTPGANLRGMLPWEGSIKEAEEAVLLLVRSSARVVADVGSYWGPHLRFLIPQFGARLRIIILERDREQVVRSFKRKVGNRNHWVSHDGTKWRLSPIDSAFPHFNAANRTEAIRHYWDLYHRLSQDLIRDFPDTVGLWATGALNSELGVREILSFAGLESDEMVLPASIWRNRSSGSARSAVYRVVQRVIYRARKQFTGSR